METLFNHPVIRLFFDLTVNGGFNLVAIMTYAVIAALIILTITEGKK